MECHIICDCIANAIYRRLIVLDDEHSAAEWYQRLRAARVNVKPLDLKIASITLANHAT